MTLSKILKYCKKNIGKTVEFNPTAQALVEKKFGELSKRDVALITLGYTSALIKIEDMVKNEGKREVRRHV